MLKKKDGWRGHCLLVFLWMRGRLKKEEPLLKTLHSDKSVISLIFFSVRVRGNDKSSDVWSVCGACGSICVVI